jgi:RNA polymerase-binding transcription factor DksA|tara:strand:- start:10 stop:237 length:228 start_codon:yes stop_codon:yes gene_type:complete
MAELTKIATFLATQQEKLREEVYSREEVFSEKSESYQESDQGSEYELKTEALDELIELIFEVEEKIAKIKEGDYY